MEARWDEQIPTSSCTASGESNGTSALSSDIPQHKHSFLTLLEKPRFDWQMWFASLSTPEQNPWFVSFIQKILDGCGPVLDLLDEPDIAVGVHTITQVRAVLYHYDFTRMDTEWARRIPGIELSNTSSFLMIPDQVWTRKLVRQYLPPLVSGNPSLRDYLVHAGYESSICSENKNRCADDVDLVTTLPCSLSVYLRHLSETPWMMPLVVISSCVMLECFLFHRRRKEKLKLD